MSSGDESRKKEDEYKRIFISPRAMREQPSSEKNTRNCRRSIRVPISLSSTFLFLRRNGGIGYTFVLIKPQQFPSDELSSAETFPRDIRRKSWKKCLNRHNFWHSRWRKIILRGFISNFLCAAIRKIVWHHSDRWRGLKFPSFCQNNFEKLDRFFAHFLLVYLFDPSQSRSALFNISRDYVVWEEIDGCGVVWLSWCHNEQCVGECIGFFFVFSRK